MSRYDEDENVVHKAGQFVTEGSWKRKLALGLAFTAAAGGIGTYKSFTIIPSGSYGVDVKYGQMAPELMQPGKYWRMLMFEQIYPLNNNTIIWENTNIGSGKNSLDQNEVRADIRTHVKIDPKVGSLALTINKVGKDHGKSIMEDLEEQSFNAVVGSRPATDSFTDAAGLLKAFKANLEWRIAQNNLPIKVDAVELLEMRAGTDSLRKVVQLRIRSDNTVEAMSGPAAIGVTGGGNTAAPAAVTPQTAPYVPGPTAPTRALPSPTDVTTHP